MTVTEADRILAAGVPLTLADGREVRVRFSFRSLYELEARWGSLEEPLARLTGLFDRTNKQLLGTIVPLLAIGLAEEGITEDALLGGLLRWSDRGDYIAAVADALAQALPAVSDEGKAQAANGSPGVASTTPPPVLAATTNGSGE